MARATTITGLAEALGRNKGNVSAWSRKPWFPLRGKDGAWDVAEVAAAVRANVQPTPGRARPGNKSRAAESPPVPPQAAPVASPAPARLDEEEAELVEVLKATADPLELARAMVRLQARRHAREVTSGQQSARGPEDFKRALQEYRVQEEAYLELARARGELISRDVAKACMGQLALRLVQALAGLEARLPAQIEAWLGDPAWRDAGAEDRSRQTRSWLVSQTRNMRQVEATHLEQLVAEELAERSGA